MKTAKSRYTCLVVAVAMGFAMFGWHVLCSAQHEPPLENETGKMVMDLGDSESFENVKRMAARMATDGAGLGYKSTAEETKTFYCRVTARKTGARLVAFSDDGVNVFIKAANDTQYPATAQLPNIDNKQHLPDTSQSVHEVPFDLQQDVTYDIRIEYRNQIYTVGGSDVDGCKLFAYKGGVTPQLGDGNSETGPVDLVISSGQGGAAVPAAVEETVGAFTVANLNDSDSSSAADNGQNNVQGEKDLMQLELKRPTGAENNDAVTLTIGAGVKLWSTSTKGTAVTDLSFEASELPKTLWAEATSDSAALRDITLTLTWNGMSDTVRATAIWATKSGFRNDNPSSKLAAAAVVLDTTITVDGGTWVAGDHIIIFSATPAVDGSWPRKEYEIVAIDGLTLFLDMLIVRAWPAGSEVRLGMSREIDNEDMVKSFVLGGGKLGSAHVSPVANNAMEMQFTVGPPGIGNEPGIMFDITRQKESICWRFDFGKWIENPVTMGEDGFTPVFPSNFPAGDEVPNDDSPNHSQQDEESSPTDNHIYSRDMPGRRDDSSTLLGYDIRFNMFEFVRVKLDGGAFDNNNGQVEGSRCSLKVPWQSRMELLQDPNTKVSKGDETTYKWMRGAPAKNMIDIVTEHSPLGTR